MQLQLIAFTICAIGVPLYIVIRAIRGGNDVE